MSRGIDVRAELELADTPLLRLRGLMFRDKIAPLLFVFDSPGRHAIHSHFVKHEFDAAYVSSEGTVVDVFSSIAPNTNLVEPLHDAKFLLELPVEMGKGLAFGEGDKVSVIFQENSGR